MKKLSILPILISFLVTLQPNYVNSAEKSYDLFSSTDRLKDLFNKERDVKLKLEQLTNNLDKQIEKVDRVLDTYYRAS